MSKPVVAERLKGKVAVVTAATLGIGYATAERLAQEGASVMISSRKQDNVDKAVKEMRSRGYDVRGVVCHVANAEHRKRLMEETVKQFGGIDILVSNAGANPATEPVLGTTESIWDKIFDVNVKGTFFLVKEAVPFMEKRGGGSIVIVSSTAAYESIPIMAVYAMSKTALLGLVKNLAPQLAEKNIRVNGLAPGFIKTKLSQSIWSNESTADYTKAMITMKRFGRPDEMAAVIAFLVSDDASYITAENVVAGGGYHSHL